MDSIDCKRNGVVREQLKDRGLRNQAILKALFCTADRCGRMATCLFLRIVAPLCFFFCPLGAVAAGMEITPFNTFDQSPLIQIYGLPRDSGADIVPTGMYRVSLYQDITNNSTDNENSHEHITMDGETYRLDLAIRYGIAPRWEAGLDVPYLAQNGGFTDTLINNWHRTFGILQSPRDKFPKNRLDYSYFKDGVQKLRLDHATSGIGDVSLTGGFSLYDSRDTGWHDRLALKAAVKLPTGKSSSLLGSGSTDFLLQLCGNMTRYGGHGSLSAYGSVGALAMSRSDVLSDQHNPLAAVGTLGFGWGPASRVSFKIQLNGRTPLYRESDLAELSAGSLVLIGGAAFTLPDGFLLDASIAENLWKGTAPDVSFHLGLTKQFCPRRF